MAHDSIIAERPGNDHAGALLQGLPPVLAPDTRLILLGSFPGRASLAARQYYAHPRNQFWTILGALWNIDMAALPYAARLDEVRRHGLGLWDVYARCRREGSLDSAIEDAELNDLASLRHRAPQLEAVAHNGGESARCMRITRALGLPVHRLPSTSPANASWSFERKLAAWREVFRATSRDMTSKQQNALAGATLSEFDGVRYLHLGTPWVQGAMRIRKPRKIELEYVQRMMAWMLWRPSEAVAEGHAVQLGLGGAAITRFTHQVLRMRTTVVEINPTVIQACRLWFHLPQDDARLKVVEADAGTWVTDEAHLQTVDVLCVDLYDHEAAAPVLDDSRFYCACRDVLAPGGVMSVNLFGRDASFDRSAELIAASFGADQVWQLAPTKEGNTIVIAARGVEVPDRETLTARAEAIEARFELPARKWLRLVRPYRPKDA